MLQTVEAVIDKSGRVHLLENIQPGKTRRALVTILEEQTIEGSSNESDSLVGSIEIIDEDLEAGSRQIAEMLNRSLSKSSEDLSR